jgi:hypothetical protein
MTRATGKDATEEFEYYGHSNKAREHMQEFEVGSYEVCSERSCPSHCFVCFHCVSATSACGY